MNVKLEKNKTEPNPVLEKILRIQFPPVGRCRLLSGGIEPYQRLHLEKESVTGDQACLGCGNCTDFCPVLMSEPARFELTLQRTSMALESTVGDDCSMCGLCVLLCPQVDLHIKNFVITNSDREEIADILKKIQSLTNIKKK